MRAPLLTLPFLALVACASPLERCLDGIDRNIAINASLIRQTQATINRGFAVETRQSLRERNRVCRGVTEDGVQVATRCEDVDVRTRRVAVAVDLDAERAKLASLRERRETLLANRDQLRGQCAARYPS